MREYVHAHRMSCLCSRAPFMLRVTFKPTQSQPCVCVCVWGRQGHVAVLNTTAASGSERSAFAGVVGPMKPYGLIIERQAIIQTHGPMMRSCGGVEWWCLITTHTGGANSNVLRGGTSVDVMLLSVRCRSRRNTDYINYLLYFETNHPPIGLRPFNWYKNRAALGG